jgi:hypothetical protein
MHIILQNINLLKKLVKKIDLEKKKVIMRYSTSATKDGLRQKVKIILKKKN